MSLYNNFIGMDIGKRNFVVTVNDQKETKEYNNTTQGIKEFIKDYKNIFGQSLCILENTGGYELELLYTLLTTGYIDLSNKSKEEIDEYQLLWRNDITSNYQINKNIYPIAISLGY